MTRDDLTASEDNAEAVVWSIVEDLKHGIVWSKLTDELRWALLCARIFRTLSYHPSWGQDYPPADRAAVYDFAYELWTAAVWFRENNWKRKP